MAIKVSGEEEAKKKYHKMISSRGPRPLCGACNVAFSHPLSNSQFGSPTAFTTDQ